MTDEKKKITFQSVVRGVCLLIVFVVLIVVLVVFGVRVKTYFSYDISSENGVEEAQYVVLGNQEQYLLIRGEDTDNPVIIWLHGGPAGSDAYMNHLFEKYLVEDYTIINWDQRGCGRTYYRNKRMDTDNSTVTFEQSQMDLDKLVDYACMRFGQVVNIESDIYSYEDALRIAKENGDDTSQMEFAYQVFLEDRTLENMLNLRNYTGVYHVAEKSANTIWEGIASPFMGVDDLKWFLKPIVDMNGYLELNQQLFDYLMDIDVRDYGLEYQVPVGFISGEQDWVTPVKYSEDYYNLVSAPEKDFSVIDGCGHSPQYDDPEAFCNELRDMLDGYIK